MRSIGLFLILCIFTLLPCGAAVNNTNTEPLKVFTYHIPDEEENQTEETEQVQDIVSDDITADTSGVPVIDESKDFENEDFSIGHLYADVLQGYASYDEFEDEEGIVLAPEFKVLTLNIKPPVRVAAKHFTGLNTGKSLYDNIYTKYNGSEYIIAPVSTTHSSKKYGGFSAGTSYEQEISNGELEQTSGVFSRYEYKRFALTTSFAKTINSTNNNYNDKFAITPELRLCQYLTLKNKFSADTVKKRKKAEIILSVNPFGKRDKDRLKFDFSASETYDDVTNSFWNRFEVNTTFKL